MQRRPPEWALALEWHVRQAALVTAGWDLWYLPL
jgi:hypothetical protein